MVKSIELTDAFVRSARAELRREEFRDAFWKGGGSLCLRISRRGRKVFSLVYRSMGGQQRRLTLGLYPALSLADARQRAREVSAQVALGGDPAKERKQAQEKALDEISFEELSELYLRDYARRFKRPKSVAEDERIINHDLLPTWRKRDIRSISRVDLVKLLDSIAARGALTMTNRVKALAGVMFRFALAKGYLPAGSRNPVREVEGRPGGPEKSRDRFLSRDEVKTLWNALDAEPEPTASVFRILLLTGQRPGEVMAMRWDSIEDGVWSVPAIRTKSGREHRIPLSGIARQVVDGLRERATQASSPSAWVFPSPKGEGHIQWLGAARRRLRESCGLQFRAHDLRRTVATHMARIRTKDVLVGKLLNHRWADREVTGVYDRWGYLPELEQALENWAAELQRIFGQEPAKVARIR